MANGYTFLFAGQTCQERGSLCEGLSKRKRPKRTPGSPWERAVVVDLAGADTDDKAKSVIKTTVLPRPTLASNRSSGTSSSSSVPRSELVELPVSPAADVLSPSPRLSVGYECHQSETAEPSVAAPTESSFSTWCSIDPQGIEFFFPFFAFH